MFEVCSKFENSKFGSFVGSIKVGLVRSKFGKDEVQTALSVDRSIVGQKEDSVRKTDKLMGRLASQPAGSNGGGARRKGVAENLAHRYHHSLRCALHTGKLCVYYDGATLGRAKAKKWIRLQEQALRSRSSSTRP